jgi:hypothetical protein
MRVASRRAEALASEFRAENEALIARVVGMDERGWTQDCPTEGRSETVRPPSSGKNAMSHVFSDGSQYRP